MSYLDFVLTINGLASRFDLSVTSWFRSLERNKRVGGNIDSLHLYGLAVDIVMDDVGLLPQFMTACSRLGLRAIAERDHIHVQIN